MTSFRSCIRQLIGKHSYITIVSGLPRSGTSMMMSALQAGGMSLLTDKIRGADNSNPRGYYEYERVKKLPQGEIDWLKDARGKAVKVISALLTFLPEKFSYRVIFMERDLEEILSSQARMLERTGKEDQHPVSDEDIRTSYQTHLGEIKAWLGNQNRIETLYVSYNDILHQPLESFQQIADFLDDRVSPSAMAEIVDESLYREREGRSN